MTYTEEEQDIIALDWLEELTYANRVTLLDGLKSRSPDFVKFEASLIKSLPRGVYNKVKDNFYSRGFRQNIWRSLEKRRIFCVTYFSEAYPEALKNIACPPLVLYGKGNAALLKERCFSVVGSRRSTAAALALCRATCADLTQHFAVVTGMADGADSAAAEGALPSKKIISVLAYGFDYVYPAVNGQLMARVEKDGLLLTEYPPSTPPQAYRFPVRNRIIAGLSEGTLVVSAGKKSGALITAAYAGEYGRHVFAFPYSVGVASGEGCNKLIKNGAMLCENALDIFFPFGLDFKTAEKEALTAEESALLALIRGEECAFVPSLAEKLGVPPFKLIPLLSSLEIKGRIVRMGGNRYSAT